MNHQGKKRIHFIAIGGNAMHNLAIALLKQGNIVSGSDTEIFEPSRSRLEKYGLLPAVSGWDESRITSEIDEIILGMYAKEDNPELIKAQKLGIKIYSYPQYLYNHSIDKKRVVISGTYGKTTITSMVLHVCLKNNIDVDYLVGSLLDGFEVMAKITNEAKFAVFEGDEYLASALDKRPKFHLYKPHIALISGIDWDHVNVFPTLESYVEQFQIFANSIEDGGVLIYCSSDTKASYVASNAKKSIKKIPYLIHPHIIENGITYLITDKGRVPLKIFGKHNMENISAAKSICNAMGISDDLFYEAISSFSGASKRLERVFDNGSFRIFKDFAHAPSKLKASISASKEQFPNSKLVAFFELYTWSSFDKNFLNQYFGIMNAVDIPIVFYDPKVVESKGAIAPSDDEIRIFFGDDRISVFNDSNKVIDFFKSLNWDNTNLLMMSPGKYGGIEVESLAGILGFYN
jgi:UDP-N-acetylmuramate: L-alanyl-gamma-D-glutamyl-meso-diaminopimelate ligase